mmetsp:Transcript_7067/g.12675  ORF Transcript_7067/g.12675 Transcript_7067/m.12675 type:complete len:109 (-) Transcript_7067:449-775(-)
MRKVGDRLAPESTLGHGMCVIFTKMGCSTENYDGFSRNGIGLNGVLVFEGHLDHMFVVNDGGGENTQHNSSFWVDHDRGNALSGGLRMDKIMICTRTSEFSCSADSIR